MLIGTMNHPARPIVDEIKWMAAMGMEFIDLTLEPPAAGVWRINPKEIRHALEDHRLKVVGHTAYYLPLTSPFESIRRAAIDELKHCLEAFSIIGAKWMNLHPGRKPPIHDWKFTVEQNLRTLRDIIPTAQDHGIGLMIENLPGEFNSVRELSELLEPLPELGLHLDIGHANLMVERNTADDILAAYGKRLRHVHLHDNKGGSADLHLPLGTGLVDTAHYVHSLQSIGYNGTITLEVFTPDRHYLEYSRDLLRKLWDEAAKQQPQARTTAPVPAGARN
jgi:sugar phosphate isomerase/epimerase